MKIQALIEKIRCPIHVIAIGYLFCCGAETLAANATRSIAAESGVRSKDAYARPEGDGHTWVIGTSQVEQVHRFANGAYTLVHLREKSSGYDFLPASTAGDEFGLTLNGARVSGRQPAWKWHDATTTVLPQGEVQLTVELDNGLLDIRKSYVVYPGTGIIRQWVTFKNISAQPVKVENPYFLSLQFSSGTLSSFFYMTGGGAYTGSQILKQIPLTSHYSRTFDTTDPPERIAVGGVKHGFGNLHYGSGAYMPWFAVEEPKNVGLFVGFDYYGHWAAEVTNGSDRSGQIAVRLAGFSKALAPGEEIVSPVAFSGVYAGDLDTMGNQLKDWQYQYLWDFTNDAYFAHIRFGAEMRWQWGAGSVNWGGGTQDNWDYRTAAHLHAIDLMRSLGADVLWQDAGWHDHLGDNDGPDFELSNEYLKKSNMRLAVWWPLYSVARQSSVYQEHPEWRTTQESMIGGTTLNTSRPDVIEYFAKQLDGKVKKWGDFQWRLDSTPVVPVNGDETPMLAEYQNMVQLEKAFRRRHPDSSIDICAGGGNLMGYETLHISDVSQLTDGGPLFISNYYSSYLFPPDKIDDWTRDSMFTFENAREILTMAPAWMSDRGLYGHEPGLMLNRGEANLRRTFEIYHYLLAQGVAGRWIHVFHPRVDGDDPVYYFERLSRDGKRGVIILKHVLQQQVTVYPKGLLASNLYDVRFENSKRSFSKPGASLMNCGIKLTDAQPGELIYIGLQNFPGSGLDVIPPSNPPSVTKHVATYMDVNGIEVEWQPAHDNNWLSRYQVFREGSLVATIARGMSYFDHSDGIANLDCKYEVQAVDGDGNVSERVTASQTLGEPASFSALGGFLAGQDYSYQGFDGWTYEEQINAQHHPIMWNGALGQMGLYQGSAGAQKVQIGASWMRPGDSSDAVRAFSVPYSGEITITGKVHKDIYHLYGDGVRVKILKDQQQLWPERGWQSISADDREGKDVSITATVRRGEKLFFVVNANLNAVDDETVWNPRLTYMRVDEAVNAAKQKLIDDRGSEVIYSGTGWQHEGLAPWSSDLDKGYLADRHSGTLSVSGTAGDKVLLRFKGTGIEIIGGTGSNRGMASVQLDNKLVGTIDTFLPANILAIARAHTSLIEEPTPWAPCPPTRLWGARDLPLGEHTLELNVLGTKNADSTGTFIGVDAFVVFGGEALEPPDTTQ